METWKPFFKKFECHFLVESTKIERATIPCETSMSDANDKTNRIGSVKWIYHKERGFASSYFGFGKMFSFSV